MTWREYFFNLIGPIKSKSKDPNTKVGCVIVGPDNEILTTGYNSFPRGLNDNIPERSERPLKYEYFEHAERNAIYNAVRKYLKGSSIYMEAIPCMDCARAIVQSGIGKVIVNRDEMRKWNSPKYTNEVMDRSVQLLTECGVEVIYVENGGKE